MTDVRGEKTVFRRQDIVALHSLPSAQAHDPCILHAPRQRGFVRRFVKAMAGVCVFLALVVAGLFVTLESGVFDTLLNAKAQTALNSAIGDGYHADVGSTVMRLTGTGTLALTAKNVALVENVSNKRLITTDQVVIALDPLPLLSGRIAVSRIEAAGATLDPSLLPQRGAIDLTALEIAKVGDALEIVFKQMDGLSRLIARSDTQLVRIADLKLSFAGPRSRVIPVKIDTLDFKRSDGGSMQIDGAISVDGQPTELHLRAERKGNSISNFDGMATGLPLAALLHRLDTPTEPAFGIIASGALTINAVRSQPGITPSLHIVGSSGAGRFEAGGFVSQLQPSEINIAYNFDRKSIDILSSMARVGRSTFPFSGALIDLPQDDPGAKKGFGIDLLLRSALSSPEDVSEKPLLFDAKADGKFFSDSHELVFDQLSVSSALGTLAGSLSMQFGDTSPQISFAALTSEMNSAAVKQLWPWWVGKKARRWLIGNVFGGTVKNGRIEVSIAKGRIANTPGSVDLNADELNVNFDIANARVNIAGDIPPLRDASGALQLKGEHLDVRIDTGTAYFPSGRSVSIEGGNFVIPNTYNKPLMAEMKMGVRGEADAIAELVTYRPIAALQRTPFKPEDFSGPLTAQVGARFGLVIDQNPPPAEWQAEMQLDGVTVNKPIDGRTITDVKGSLQIDPQKAVLDAKAKIDGLDMSLALVEPVGADSTAKRSREVSGVIPEGKLGSIAPGLADLIDGPLPVSLSIDEDNRQRITADLGDASLSLPFIGWSKGRGIPAKVAFETSAKDGVTDIDDLVFSGDGFGAKGDLEVDKSGLVSAKFSTVTLAAGDKYAVSVKRQKNGYGVVVNGRSADIRPVIESLRSSQGDAGKSEAKPTSIAIEADLDQVQGFHSESLSNVIVSYAAHGRQIDALKVSAITESGQAVVAKLDTAGAGELLELTSGDAGALARFADLYNNMRGGLLNLKLRTGRPGSWHGTLDIRKFSLADEKRLQSIVSTPADADGRSLNQAVKKDVDVSSAQFERGFANVALTDGTVVIKGGVVRGTDIGATFQGTLRNPNGDMDMTGTFMPAYGLNRLFGELPIIGAILGNGRDRGLIGITFRMTGSFEKPNLQINPLSIIAPGVFRSIFEFR